MKHLEKLIIDSIIKEDTRFYYKALKSSVDKKRANTLPLLWKNGDYWIPVCSIEDIPDNKSEFDALVYEENTSYEEVLWDVLQSDDLNIFDIANIIQLLDSNSPDYNKSLWARRLKIGLEQWEKIKILSCFKIEWTSFFLSKNVPLKRIMNFSDHDLRKLLLPLLSLNPGINVLESIANLLSELAHRKKVSVDMVWEELKISLILTSDEMQSTFKLQAIRTKLLEARYPVISRYRKMLNEHITGMPRTAGIDLFTDQDFETPGLRLQVDIRSRNDIEKLQEWLNDQRSQLEKIIDIQKGNATNDKEQ